MGLAIAKLTSMISKMIANLLVLITDDLFNLVLFKFVVFLY